MSFDKKQQDILRDNNWDKVNDSEYKYGNYRLTQDGNLTALSTGVKFQNMSDKHLSEFTKMKK